MSFVDEAAVNSSEDKKILSGRTQQLIQLMPERGQIDFNLGAHRR
jgi:hypothetical protein